MTKGILGKKIGMTQIFAQDGTVVPVTVVQAGPCSVVQVKTLEKDGYEAVKVGFGTVKEQNVNKADKGQFVKANVPAARYMREFKFENAADYKAGDVITCDIFAEGDKVDVTAKTKGHGFSGVIQRWNQHTGPMSHGSGAHRVVGSMGASSSPSHVFKNKHMPGQWGNEQVTVQNLQIVRVDTERGVLLIKGAVPGAQGALLTIKQSVKRK